MNIGRRGPASAALALAALVAVLVALVAPRPADPPLLGGVDRWWRALVLGWPGWAEAASRALKAIGSGSVMVPVRLAVGGVLLVRRRYRALGAWLLAWALADALTAVLKPTIGRLRPDGTEATSFPSGHAKTAAQVAVGLALLARDRWRRIAWVAAVAWVVAMALSRTALDEHWLSDVAAGAALGAACALGAWALLDAGREATTPAPRAGADGAPPPGPSRGRGLARGPGP